MPRTRYNISQYLPKIDPGSIPSGLTQIYTFLMSVAGHIDQVIDRDINDINENQTAISEQVTETLKTTKQLLDQNEEIVRRAITDEIHGLDERLRNEYVKKEELSIVKLIVAAAKKKPMVFVMTVAAIVLLLPMVQGASIEIFVGFFRKTFDINIRTALPWLFGQ